MKAKALRTCVDLLATIRPSSQPSPRGGEGAKVPCGFAPSCLRAPVKPMDKWAFIQKGIHLELKKRDSQPRVFASARVPRPV